MKKIDESALLNHKKLAYVIKQSGLTQEEFAEAVDISDRYLRNLQTRDINVSVSTAYNICNFLNVSIEDMLITKKDKKNPQKE